MTAEIQPRTGFRTLMSKCPEIPAKSLILFPDTFSKSVRGQECPESLREGLDKPLKSNVLFLRTKCPGVVRFGSGRTHPLSIERVSIRRVRYHGREMQNHEMELVNQVPPLQPDSPDRHAAATVPEGAA
jgi:hypothetical protein